MIERNGLYWMPFRHASSQKRGVSVPSRESVPASKFASVFRRNLALLAQDPTAANDGQATVDDGPLVFAPGQDVPVPCPHQLSSLASWREGGCLCLSALSAANFIPDDESSSTTAQRPATDLPISDNHRSGNCCCAPFVETAPQAPSSSSGCGGACVCSYTAGEASWECEQFSCFNGIATRIPLSLAHRRLAHCDPKSILSMVKKGLCNDLLLSDTK